MVSRRRHPSRVIEAAIQYAENKGWQYKKTGRSAHAWGKLLCPFSHQGGCALSIWSTPRSEENHAKQILHRIDKCPHGEDLQ